MMKLISTKSILAVALLSMLAGCKTVSSNADEKPSEIRQKVATSQAKTVAKVQDERHIEEVPEVLEMIEASKAKESGRSAKSTSSKSRQVSAKSDVVLNVKPQDICNDWQKNRGHANSEWLGKTIAFKGRMTSMSHSDQYSNTGNMVFIDADQSVSLGVVFSSIRETLMFSTGQSIALNGELTEIKRASNNRCLFIVNNAQIKR